MGKNRDAFIIFGIFFSISAMIAEITAPLFFPAYMFPIYFATNIPEIVRVSFLARRRILNAAVYRERETIGILNSR